MSVWFGCGCVVEGEEGEEVNMYVTYIFDMETFTHLLIFHAMVIRGGCACCP
jgi:hypothetical protein